MTSSTKHCCGCSSNSLLVEGRKQVSHAIPNADIVILSSTSMTPLLTAETLEKRKKNLFCCGLTAFNDISFETVKLVDRLVVDDAVNAIERLETVSKISFTDLKKELNITSVSSRPAQRDNYGLTLYLPVGISVMDMAIANYLYNKLQH